MDWLIYHLVGDVLTHYWYGVQCKIFGYIENKKVKELSLVLCFGPVTSHSPMLYLDGDDIAFMVFCNHPPKVRTMHASGFKWPQCDYPFVAQGIIYKHVIKIYKMFHPTILDGAIVQKTCAFHGVQRGSLVTNLPTLENLLPKEEHNLPQIEDFSTSEDIEHHDL
jgi:hypothetical protein